MITLSIGADMYQPIETIYNGYRFRSRLEARWAVFFDTLGINYEYEKEGYDLDGRGTWYLPDFWIEAWDMFVEIKPNFPSDEEESKCRKLSKCLGKSSLLLWGQPGVAPVDKKDKHSLWKHEYQFDIF